MSYYDPQKVGAFSGAHSFQKIVKLPLKWLKSQDVYILHKPMRRCFSCKKAIVPGANFQMQADLIDFSSLKQYKNNFKYILVMIDVFSKKGYTYILSQDKNKLGNGKSF